MEYRLAFCFFRLIVHFRKSVPVCLSQIPILKFQISDLKSSISKTPSSTRLNDAPSLEANDILRLLRQFHIVRDKDDGGLHRSI